MKIVKSEGCTAYYTQIDDVDLNELTPEAKEKLLLRLFTILKKEQDIDYVINHILENIDHEVESGGYCEQCSDHVYRHIYDIDEIEKELNISNE